jgi:hypothetical protein
MGWSGSMKGKIMFVGLMLVLSCFVVSARPQSRVVDWQLTIDVYAGGHTYCIIGEKSNASDGVDVFDVPHPPFQPPGRAFVFIRQPSFPELYTRLWMEYRHLTGVCRVWNLSLFYVPMERSNAVVTIQWDCNQACSSGYVFMILIDGCHVTDMKICSSYSFVSSDYHLTSMRILTSNLFTH